MNSRCKCRFSEHADTILGSHRDPISSEKCWLDFAVRELSRVAAGKARGQEAVWRSQCKPAWWDCVCPHPWKNPTANPKDSKDTLKAKFECLVQHLRKEGQIPREMVEEIERWEKGQVQELFLMTSFSCMLGQASNLHSVLDETCRKMEDTGISVDHNILADLVSCLSACVKKINSMKDKAQEEKKSQAGCSDTKGASCSGQKRRHDELDTADFSPPPKHSKPSSVVSSRLTSATVSPSSSSPSSSSSSSHFPFTVQSVFSAPLNPEQQKPIDKATLQKLLQQISKRTTAAPPLAQSQGNIVQAKSASVPRPRQPLQKKQTPVLSNGSLAAITSAPLTNLSAQSSSLTISETKEFGDFLDMDLVCNDGITDYEFFDKLLEEKSPFVTPSSSENTGSPFQMPTEGQSLPVQNQPLNVSSSDPLLSHNSVTAGIPQNFSVPVQIPLDTGADRLDCWGADTVVEDLGIALSPDARDKVQGETETVSDSGYETSSPISHRSSLDVDPYNNADLSSPDLEALLDAFS